MLKLSAVAAYYRDPTHLALQDIDLSVEPGRILTLLGPNGAGKSTVLKAIARQAHVATGEICFEGKRLNECPAHRLCTLGVVYVPDGQRVWPNMSVDENLRLGAFARRDRRTVAAELAGVYEILPRLKPLSRRGAHGLSGGERQMVAMGRALMASPRCLLLDEPSMGLAPGMIEEMFARIRSLVTDRRLAAIIVEQNGRQALHVSDQVAVLRQGRIALDRPAADILWERDIEPLFFADSDASVQSTASAGCRISPGNGQ